MRLVLLVDDSRIQRARIRQALELAGLLVEEATSVTDALACIHLRVPDLVVFDSRLSDHDAFATMRALRDAAARCPFVVVTADQQALTTTLLRAHGACEVLTKPLDPTRLVERVEEVFSVA